MYKEVAIDPKCMAEYIYYVLVKREFGFDKGRYAAADVKQWAREAFQIVKKSDMQTIRKKSVTNFLNRVQRGMESERFLLASDRKLIKGDDWNSWWVAQMKHRPFSASVSESDLEGTINHDAILDDCQQWKVPPSVSVDRSAEDIVSPIESLIYISREVLLVDQFFRFSDNNTLLELFKMLSVSPVTKFTVVTSMDTVNIQQVYEREYKALNIHSIMFNWIKAPARYFHDRYFVSDVGAVKAGHGFMPEVKKGIHADKLNINIVSIDEAQGVKQSLAEVLESGAASAVFSQ